MNQTDTLPQPEWGFLKKNLFRFFFSFCVISIFPILSSLLWPQIIKWTSLYFYNENVASHPTGSGDTLYDFYDVTIKLIVAAIAAFIWTIADRKRKSYATLLYWQEVYIRYYLGYFLLIYGLMKVIKLQFSQPLLSQLLIPLGQKSPMGLAWTFIGFSDSYTIFSGLCEVTAAGLLFYKKTRTLGALMSFGVMLNVFLMNMSYDIPVKLFSLQLIILSVFLIGLDYKRLLNLFILNKTAEPQQSRSPFKDIKANLAVLIIKGLAVLGGFGFMIFTNLQSQSLYGDMAPKPPMYGIYEVEEFIMNNDTIAPMANDTTRWRYVVVEKGNQANIFNMKSSHYDELQFYTSQTDTLKKEILLLNYQDSTQVAKLRYHKKDSKHYIFNGVFKGDSIRLHTLRKDENDFPLTNSKFKWVNEYPYNR